MEKKNVGKKDKNEKQGKLKYYLDDKGRKKYDVSSLYKPPVPQEQSKPKLPTELTYLKPHDDIIGVEDLKGKTLVKQSDKGLGVFYCKTCDATLYDNTAYIDHLNGKRHNKLLGMSLRVEKVELSKVKEKLLSLKRKAPDSKK
jgi:U4/U6.U5 tri-snRNP component SNU23